MRTRHLLSISIGLASLAGRASISDLRTPERAAREARRQRQSRQAPWVDYRRFSGRGGLRTQPRNPDNLSGSEHREAPWIDCLNRKPALLMRFRPPPPSLARIGRRRYLDDVADIKRVLSAFNGFVSPK